jgi:hypothetical protein
VVTLSQSATGTTTPALAAHPDGTVHVIWGDGVHPSFEVLHTWSSDPLDAASWSQPKSIVTSTLSLDDVALLSTASGTLHAAWVEGNAAGEVWYATWPDHRVFLPLVLKN